MKVPDSVDCGGYSKCETTVKAGRSEVMQKMKAASLADLVNMASRLGVARTTGSDIMANS